MIRNVPARYPPYRVHVAVYDMASGLVRACLSSVLTDSTFGGRSRRSKEALEQVNCLLCKISEENNVECYDEFAQKLMDALERTY